VNWHWLFLINVPIGTVAVVVGVFLLPNIGYRERRRFDVGGLILGSGGLSLLVLGLSEGNVWGWTSAATVACLTLGVAALVGFVPHELRAHQPMLQLRMFKERVFRLSAAAMLCVLIAQYGRLVFIPLELESVRGISALRVGLLFLPAAGAQAIGMQTGGRLVDRVGARLPMVAGSAILFAAVAGYATLTLTTPVALVAVLLMVQGLGAGLMGAPATVAGLSDLPRHLLAQGTAVRSLTGMVGGALSVALLGAIVAIGTGAHPTPHQAQAAYNTAFAVAAGIVLVALVLSCRIPNPKRTANPERMSDPLADDQPAAPVPAT
jgi:MFS family permease